MNRGYVKVWRKIEDSGLMQMPNTLALFMHILFNATHKDRKLGTPTGVIDLKRGQYVSGRIELASRLKQSEQEIRTSLKRLENLDILTITVTNRYSVYTIENYGIYQDNNEATNQQNNQQSTSNQPADNQQSTTKQECNNLNIEALKPIRKISKNTDDDFETFWINYPKKKNKGTALKSWLKERPRLDNVLYALSWQKESDDWKKEGGKYIPYPSSYLNAHGWEDEEPKNNGVPF